jgi:peptidoglycan/LPS O-acetylase OafA/YrhL
MSLQRIYHLDGLRGFAILMVVLFHAYARWPDHLSFASDTKSIFLFKYGYLGVQLFFMISGFVIFMSLDKSSGIVDFLKKRWLRLFPAMLMVSVAIYLSASFFFERPAGQPGLLDLIPGLTFIHPEIVSRAIGIKVLGLEGAFWSLYVEMMFYVFSGVLYFVLGREYILKSIFCACVISTVVVFTIDVLGAYIELLSNLSSVFGLVGFRHYGWFFIGCFIYEQVHKRVGGADVLMLVMVILCNLYFGRSDVFALIFMLLVMLLFYFSFCSEKIKALFVNRFFMFFGLISYPLYLVHENMMVSAVIKIIKFDVLYPVLTPVVPIVLLSLFSYCIVRSEPVIRDFIKYKMLWKLLYERLLKLNR